MHPLRRRPLSLKELLAIVGLLVFGGISALGYYQDLCESGLPGGSLRLFALAPHAIASLVLVTLADSPRHARMLRCTRCWTPRDQPDVPEFTLDFWAIFVSVFCIYLFFYVGFPFIL